MTYQEMFDRGEIEDDTIYKYYATKGHEDKDLPAWSPGKALKEYIPFQRKWDKDYFNKLLWGSK